MGSRVRVPYAPQTSSKEIWDSFLLCINHKSLSIPNVPLDIQNKVMVEVEEYEAIIAKAQAKMQQCTEQKKQILKKYIE